MNKLDYPRRNGTHKVRITSKSALHKELGVIPSNILPFLTVLCARNLARKDLFREYFWKSIGSRTISMPGEHYQKILVIKQINILFWILFNYIVRHQNPFPFFVFNDLV